MAKELPEKTETVIYCEMDEDHQENENKEIEESDGLGSLDGCCNCWDDFLANREILAAIARGIRNES